MLRLIPLSVLASLALSPAALSAQEPSVPAPAQLTLEHRMLLRCSAAFAITSWAQGNGNAAALQYPQDEAAYRDFFVQASAQVMEEAALDEAQIQAALESEAQALVDANQLDAVMGPCLALLQQ